MNAQLDNRQLAANGTWIAAVTWLECTACSFLAQDLEANKPCPNCGQIGPRRLFPDLSSDRLLEMVSYFYLKAWDRVDDTQVKLVADLEHTLGRTFDAQIAVAAAHQAQQRRRRAKDSREQPKEQLLGVMASLNLASLEEARKAFFVLLRYSETNEEHQVVVLLTAAMLERLFAELLVRMFLKAGKDWQKANSAVKTLKGHHDRERVFAGIAGIDFGSAVEGAGLKDFTANWQHIRERRNKFIHGLPFVIELADAEKAFELAKHAFLVFARLHSLSCVTGRDP